MSRALRIRLTGILLLIVIAAGAFWFKPMISFLTNTGGHTAHASSSLPYHEFADGPYTVKGNSIVGADGQSYLFHGVGRDGLEFSCTGGGLSLHAAHLAF